MTYPGHLQGTCTDGTNIYWSIRSGPMNHGVQTVCLKDDVMYFGCYGLKEHPGNTFGVNVKDLTRPSRCIEFPYIVPTVSRFSAPSSEGMFVLDGTMWIGSGCELKNPPPDANGKPQRLFGARAYPRPEFGQRAARHGIGG